MPPIQRGSNHKRGNSSKPSNSKRQRAGESSRVEEATSQSLAGVEDTKESEQPVWQNPSLDKNHFYARACYINSQRRQQRRSPVAGRIQSCTPALNQHLLDLIALLFARFKTCKSLRSPSIAATAMVKDEPQGKRPHFTIYVAKNDGPQTEDRAMEVSDISFAEKLSQWSENLIEPDEPSEPDPDHPMWNEMLLFWEDRLQYHKNQVLHNWRLLDDRRKKSCLELLDLHQIDGFDTDLTRAENIVKTLQGEPSQGKPSKGKQSKRKSSKRKLSQGNSLQEKPSQENIDYRDICREADDFKNPPSHWKYVKETGKPWRGEFRKLVKNVSMFGVPLALWKTLVQFKRGNGNVVIKIELLPKPGNYSLDLRPVRHIIGSWRARNPSFKKVSIKADTLSISFHCELQLLQKFMHNDQCYDYFGCSKLSCYFCWRILVESGSRFRTKGCHEQIYPRCAFPFKLSNEFKFTAQVLRQFQDEMTAIVLSLTNGSKDRSSRVSSISQTDVPFLQTARGSPTSEYALPLITTLSLRTPPLSPRQLSLLKIESEQPSDVKLNVSEP
jgi:OTT_1508-like deaminase